MNTRKLTPSQLEIARHLYELGYSPAEAVEEAASYPDEIWIPF